MKARLRFSGAVDNRVKHGEISAPTLFTIYFPVNFLVAFNKSPDGIYMRYWTSDKVYNIRRLLVHTKVSSSLVRELFYTDDYNIVTYSED